jgi:general secretion pathway protein D
MVDIRCFIARQCKGEGRPLNSPDNSDREARVTAYLCADTLSRHRLRNRWAALALSFSLAGCASSAEMIGLGPGDSVDPIRNTNLTAHFTTDTGTGTQPVGTRGAGGPQIFPGFGATAAGLPRAGAGGGSTASAAGSEPGAGSAEASGVEINFENADIQTVAKSIVVDKLGLNVVIDPRVQGSITIASASPIAKKDLLPVFESVLRMANASIIRDGDLVKIVPLTDAGGASGLLKPNEPGFGVTVIPLHFASATAVAKAAEGFLTRPGAVRADPTRNILMIQGTEIERQNAADVVASFDVEWLRNQSVGIYPLKSTSPDVMIHELERVFETADGGQGQGLISFQPIARLNAVLAVAHDRRFLEQTTQWVRRLDREDTTGTTVRVYRLEHGNATKIAKILSDIFTGRSPGSSGADAASQLAPGANASQSRLDSITSGSSFSNNAGGQGGGSTGGMTSNNGSSQSSGGGFGNSTNSSQSGGQGQGANSFSGFADDKSNEKSGSDSGSSSQFGALAKGMFQSVRITADTSNNSIIVYSNEDDYRVIERSIRELDRPTAQVGIDATIAEVTLTDGLQYGVQYYLANSKGSIGFNGGTTTPITGDTPGFNLVLGSQTSPKVVLSALQNLTSVKVLSAPSLVVGDNQPAFLQVGNSIPISTGSATVLSAQNTIVNTTTYQDTGIILKVWPHIHANGEVQLEIDQEVSGVVGGIPAGGTSTLTPTLSQRRVHSTVSVADGQTVLLGGLISDEDDRTQNGIPGLRQLRVVGDLFGTTNNSKTRSEIIVFVRPRLINDGIDAQNVAEEFRARLNTMHTSNGNFYTTTPLPVRKTTGASYQ